MRAELLFPSLYLREADLIGKEFVLTIDIVQVELLQMARGIKKRKPVMYFVETARKGETLPSDEAKKLADILSRRTTEKRLVLNKTNKNAIVLMYGDETKNWQGKAITLFPAVTDFGPEKNLPCIRVRDIVPLQRKKEETQ